MSNGYYIRNYDRYVCGDLYRVSIVRPYEYVHGRIYVSQTESSPTIGRRLDGFTVAATGLDRFAAYGCRRCVAAPQLFYVGDSPIVAVSMP